MPDRVIDNEADKRFELTIDDLTVFANYNRHGAVVHLMYVEAPIALRGTGAAGTLMEGIVNLARAQQVKLKPVCGYAAAWLKRHPDMKDVVA